MYLILLSRDISSLITKSEREVDGLRVAVRIQVLEPFYITAQGCGPVAERSNGAGKIQSNQPCKYISTPFEVRIIVFSV